MTLLVTLITQIVHGRTSSGGSLCLADLVHACSAHKLGPARKQAPAPGGEAPTARGLGSGDTGGTASLPCRATPKRVPALSACAECAGGAAGCTPHAPSWRPALDLCRTTALAAVHPASPSRAAVVGRNRQVQMKSLPPRRPACVAHASALQIANSGAAPAGWTRSRRGRWRRCWRLETSLPRCPHAWHRTLRWWRPCATGGVGCVS